MYLHAHWHITVPPPGSRKPHSDRLIVCNKRAEVWWGWGWGWEGGRTASGIGALTSGACVWYIPRLAPARITSPPRPSPAKPGWVKKEHVFWSSSFLQFLIENRCSNHWFKNQSALQTHCLNNWNWCSWWNTQATAPQAHPLIPRPPSSFPYRRVEPRTTKAIHIPTFFRPEQRIIQVVHNIFKIFTQGRAHFSNFHKGKCVSIGPVWIRLRIQELTEYMEIKHYIKILQCMSYYLFLYWAL